SIALSTRFVMPLEWIKSSLGPLFFALRAFQARRACAGGAGKQREQARLGSRCKVLPDELAWPGQRRSAALEICFQSRPLTDA
ncbi:MAG: hypothetical protein ABJA84_11330, partial [Polaromonas sp.]